MTAADVSQLLTDAVASQIVEAVEAARQRQEPCIDRTCPHRFAHNHTPAWVGGKMPELVRQAMHDAIAAVLADNGLVIVKQDDDLRERLEQAAARLDAMRDERKRNRGDEYHRLGGKAEGVRLAISYLVESRSENPL